MHPKSVYLTRPDRASCSEVTGHLQPAVGHSSPARQPTCTTTRIWPKTRTLRWLVTRIQVVGPASFPCRAAPASARVGPSNHSSPASCCLCVQEMRASLSVIQICLSRVIRSSRAPPVAPQDSPCPIWTQADGTVSASPLLTACPLCAPAGAVCNPGLPQLAAVHPQQAGSHEAPGPARRTLPEQVHLCDLACKHPTYYTECCQQAAEYTRVCITGLPAGITALLGWAAPHAPAPACLSLSPHICTTSPAQAWSFTAVPDMSFCTAQPRPERWQQTPCHLCAPVPSKKLGAAPGAGCLCCTAQTSAPVDPPHSFTRDFRGACGADRLTPNPSLRLVQAPYAAQTLSEHLPPGSRCPAAYAQQPRP